MKKDRCFKNLIGKASVFFVFLCMGMMLSGCGDAYDSVNHFLQDNNILNDGDVLGFGKKDSKSEEAAEDESVIIPEDIASENDGESQGFNTDAFAAAGAERDKARAEAGASGSDDDFENSEAFTYHDKSEEDESSGDDTEVENSWDTELAEDEGVSEDTKSSDNEESDSATEQANEGASVFDPVKVNKAIDDLISEIERETGRSGRRRTVEEDQDEAGQDATTYFSDTFQEAQRESLGLSIVDIDELKKAQAGNYAFEHLTDEGQTIYVELLKIMQKRAEDIVVSTLDEDVLDVVFQFVMADHPEIFYVDGYTYTRYTVGGVLRKISFTGNYIYSADEIAERQAKIDAYTDTCLSKVPRDGDAYSKVKYIYEYLITNTEYDATAPDNQNICSVFIYGKSVCQGYAKATQYLLNKLGVPTTLVTGKVKGVGHAWNLVLVDGEYTYVDTTWGDSSYQKLETGGEEDQKLPLINYTYLCCPTQDIEKTHVLSETLPVPECTSMRNNYYVREREYFTETDMDTLEKLFKRSYQNGSNNVTIKCSTKNIYDDFKKKLFDDKMVFRFMEGSNSSVSYSSFETQYILVIWLY